MVRTKRGGFLDNMLNSATAEAQKTLDKVKRKSREATLKIHQNASNALSTASNGLRSGMAQAQGHINNLGNKAEAMTHAAQVGGRKTRRKHKGRKRKTHRKKHKGKKHNKKKRKSRHKSRRKSRR
jgi:hypothetical protein